MDIHEYDAQKMSAACYEMGRRYRTDEKKWTDIGTLWNSVIPRKNPDRWVDARTAAIEATKKVVNDFDESSFLYGTHVIASKVLSAQFSRSYADSPAIFLARYSRDNNGVREEVDADNVKAKVLCENVPLPRNCQQLLTHNDDVIPESKI
jgi:hypothetical protein